jgi:dTDP-4-dehydrorhamnose reductase
MSNCLLIGGSGGLGDFLRSPLVRLGTVDETSRRQQSHGAVFFDAMHGLNGLDVSRWRVVVYAAGITSLSECEAKPELSERVNFRTPIEVAEAVSACGGFFLYLSSSAANEYCEMSVAEALHAHQRGATGASAYGLHKYLAEQELLELENSAILRLAKVATPQWVLPRAWVSRLAAGGRIEAFDDHFLSPLTPRVLSDLVSVVVQQRLTGLFEVSASDQLSYFDAAMVLARGLGGDGSLVDPVSAVSRLDTRHVLRKAMLDSHRSVAHLGAAMISSVEVLQQYLPTNP